MTDTVLDKDQAADAKVSVIDCDIHPSLSRPEEIAPFLPLRWRDHLKDYGLRSPNPFYGALPYPRMGNGMRQDSYPPGGGPAASDLAFMQKQHLDPLGIEHGLLHALNAGPSLMNLEMGAALCSAYNDWQIDKWCGPDPRLKAGISFAQEDARLAVAEIEERSKDKRFVQAAFVPKSLEPAGRRRYWSIWEACEALDLPVGMHSAAYGQRANTGAGWASFYVEEHYSFAHVAQTVLVSMIFEGVFEHFPKLKLVLVEGGFAWLAPLMWRMDREWEAMRGEVPHVKMKPSDYVRRNVWVTTQPMEEPPNPRHVAKLLDWVGRDRLLFSTDYPHWDFDHPDRTIKIALSEVERHAIFYGTAAAVYGL